MAIKKVYIGPGANSIMIYHNDKFLMSKNTNMSGILIFDGPRYGDYTYACINNTALSKRIKYKAQVTAFGHTPPGLIEIVSTTTG